MNRLAAICLLPILLVSPCVLADWQLDNNLSSITFGSVKNGAVVESHTFGQLSGSVTAAGKATVEINLASVDTAIAIRDERMTSLLFEVSQFPVARFEADIAIDTLNSMPVGEGTHMPLTGSLSLHGKTVKLTIPVTVFRGSNDAYQITSTRAAVIAAADFDLLPGIEALRAIAGLTGITPASPVSFSLVFRQKTGS
jgi:polyisoprenoid-binding protein YceI